MKKLKKILLINWLYFSKELIEVEDINFLTGKNGAGKSTVIDALQLVLLGETNARNFNKAANESSQRTLDGYLRADMDNQNPKSRKGKDFSSYIACEFWDDMQGQKFVFGIVFDCRSDGSRREQYFTYDGEIPESCYLIDKQAMDIYALRGYLKELPGSHYVMYDSNKKYRDDIAAKWNIHTEQIFRMLKKAVSFKPIVDIQKFITENVCDIPDKPDIEMMQQNIRDYKHHEMLAHLQEEKLAALERISKQYHEMQNLLERWRQQKFITLWAQKEDLQAQIFKLENEQKDNTAAFHEKKQEIERLGKQVAESTKRKEQLITDRANSTVFQEESRLRRQEESLNAERNQIESRLENISLEIKREAQSTCALCNKIEVWSKEELLQTVCASANDLHHAFIPLCKCTPEFFAHSLSDYENVQKCVFAFSEAMRDTIYRLNTHLEQLAMERNENNKIISNLKRGIKDYPEGLLSLKSQLAKELESVYKKVCPLTILADELEIVPGQEEWRGAVEGYLSSQKFYLLVDPEYYETALIIFDRIKRDYKLSFGLVDVGKLCEKEDLNVKSNSLATKVETQNALARSYIDYLLGRVICCQNVKQLRDFSTAITADGMLYKSYVARPISKARMEDCFIGQRSIAKRLERLEALNGEIRLQLNQYEPFQKELSAYSEHENLFTNRFVQSEIKECQGHYLRNLEISNELNTVMDGLSHLDLMWLAELDDKINSLGQDVDRMLEQQKTCSSEMGKLEGWINNLSQNLLPELNDKLTEKEDAVNDEYNEQFQENIGIPRYQQELVRLHRASTVAKNFGDSVPQSYNAFEQAKSQLLSLRSDYIRDFQPCTFRVDVMDNEEYDAERKVLEESELPQFRDKIRLAKESAMEQFQNDFLAKLKSSIDQVTEQVKNLNRALRQTQFGTDSYQFKVDKNPDYAEYYAMITDPELMEGEYGLFAQSFQNKYQGLIEQLFGQIATSDDTQLNARKQSELQQNIERFTDFRTYLKFDLETTDQNGSKQLLSQTLNTKSGGETQTPFYIAVLASFAQMYRVNDLSSVGNTVRLVIFDEAFNKMDSDRIIESVRLLRKMHLQAIICTPPDKLPDIMPEADRTLLVCKEKYNMRILPYSKEPDESWNKILS